MLNTFSSIDFLYWGGVSSTSHSPDDTHILGPEINVSYTGVFTGIGVCYIGIGVERSMCA